MTFSTLAYALLAGIVPSAVWLAFWLREDSVHPEPHWLIAGCFLGGMLSVIVAIFAEKYVGDLIADQTIRYTLWAGVEEVVKLLAVAIVALYAGYDDEPIDAMIYMITVALGFAAIENTLFIMTPLANGQFAQGIATDSMRFIGATLVHIVSSALVGFAIGYAFYKPLWTKMLAVIYGLIGAIIIHALFNLSIVNAEPVGVLRTFMWIWGAVVILIILFEEIKAVHSRSLHKPVSEVK